MFKVFILLWFRESVSQFVSTNRLVTVKACVNNANIHDANTSRGRAYLHRSIHTHFVQSSRLMRFVWNDFRIGKTFPLIKTFNSIWTVKQIPWNVTASCYFRESARIRLNGSKCWVLTTGLSATSFDVKNNKFGSLRSQSKLTGEQTAS